jgi:hypothetical protein
MFIPKRYAPNGFLGVSDGFFEPMSSLVPWPYFLQDGSMLALAKCYLVSNCIRAGAWTLHGGHQNLVTDVADMMAHGSDTDLFVGRQKEPVSVAMKNCISLGVMDPLNAISALYLATQFEFYFRILSGSLNIDGTWKNSEAKERAIELLPSKKKQLNRERINSVELAFSLAILRQDDARCSVVRELSYELNSRVTSNLYKDLGGRIGFCRHRSAHGEWGDVSAEGVPTFDIRLSSGISC